MLKKIGLIVGVLFILVAAGALIYWQSSKGSAPKLDASKREIWESEGYNYIIETDNKKVIIYSHTKDSLLPFAYGKIDSEGHISGLKLHGNGLLNIIYRGRVPFGQFQNGVLSDGTGYVKRFKRIDRLPQATYTKFTKDPVANFEAFWQRFDENYSLFDVAKVDWKQVYEEYRPKITEDTSSGELRKIFEEIIQKLDDGHTQIMNGLRMTSSRSEGEREALYNGNHKRIKRNVQRTLGDKLASDLGGDIRYIKTQEGIGYVRFDSFLSLDTQAIDQALDRMAQALDGSKGVIIDLRLNGGGMDDFALEAASRFATEKKLVYSKTVRNGGYDAFATPTPIYLEPHAKAVKTDRLVVLTSEATSSAAEIATMAFGELEHATIIGERTNGIHSDMLMSLLPNKWVLTLSGERYIATDGKIHEHVGLQPDEEVLISKENIEEGKDPVLDRALELLRGSNNG